MEELANELLFNIDTHYNEYHEMNVFIEKFKLNINHRNENGKGRTALHYAIEVCRPKMIKKILINGADPNIKDYYGETALHYAAKFGCKEDIIIILLKYGANINITNNIGETPILFSVLYKQFAGMKLLLNYSADITISNIYGTSVIKILANKDPLEEDFKDVYMYILKLLWNLEK